MNESKDSDEETKIKHVGGKRTYHKCDKEKQFKFRKLLKLFATDMLQHTGTSGMTV